MKTKTFKQIEFNDDCMQRITIMLNNIFVHIFINDMYEDSTVFNADWEAEKFYENIKSNLVAEETDYKETIVNTSTSN